MITKIDINGILAGGIRKVETFFRETESAPDYVNVIMTESSYYDQSDISRYIIDNYKHLLTSAIISRALEFSYYKSNVDMFKYILRTCVSKINPETINFIMVNSLYLLEANINSYNPSLYKTFNDICYRFSLFKKNNLFHSSYRNILMLG